MSYYVPTDRPNVRLKNNVPFGCGKRQRPTDWNSRTPSTWLVTCELPLSTKKKKKKETRAVSFARCMMFEIEFLLRNEGKFRRSRVFDTTATAQSSKSRQQTATLSPQLRRSFRATWISIHTWIRKPHVRLDAACLPPIQPHEFARSHSLTQTQTVANYEVFHGMK